MTRIVVVGAGAAGMMCAGGLAEAGHAVTVIEKNDRPGRKLFITGKGRCNLTNDCDVRTFLDNVVTNPKFLNSAIYGFTPADCMAFFESLGVRLKVERGNRVFPVSDKSNDVVKALEKYALRSGATFVYGERALSVEVKDGNVAALSTDKGIYPCDAIVLATGGATYPATGSTGDGYDIARRLGHTVKKSSPALVPLIADGVDGLQGLSLRNVGVSVFACGREAGREFGEMLFTHNGVSGPAILTLSSKTGEYCDEKGNYGNGAYVSVDLKPALDEATLDARVLREISLAPKADVKNMLCSLMPRSLVPKVLAQCGFDGGIKNCELSKKQRETLVSTVKDLRFPLISKDKMDFGIITRGGVDVAEINPKDMSSKKTGGLYIIGELLDVDALTGGFNLQIAFSTAKAVVRAFL